MLTCTSDAGHQCGCQSMRLRHCADVTATVDISPAASDTPLRTTMALADGGDAATTVSTTATVDVTARPVL